MTYFLSKRSALSSILKKNTPVFSSLKYISSTKVDNYLTSSPDPRNHTEKDIGVHYIVDNSLALDTLFKERGISKFYSEECVTFGETRFLIRKPAIDIINCLKKTDFNNSANRYILYGKYGNGKTMTLLHLVHYAHVSEWLTVHVPNISNWMYLKTEVVPSTSGNDLIDLPLMASSWLTHFKNQNLKLIEKLDIRIHNDYKWNIQQENKSGESLLSLVDHGIAQGKYSSAVVNAVLNEVKINSKNGKIKTLVALDEYHLVYQPPPKSSNHKCKFRTLSNVSFVAGFQDLVTSNWHNGVIILALGGKDRSRTDDHLPLNQLTLKGFEDLSPFIPIEVPPLTEKEITSTLQYYKSKKWLPNSDGDDELQVLCAGNALNLRCICGPL